MTNQIGDVLLFSGNGIFSGLIQVGTGSKFSHVGLIIPAEGDRPALVLESTTLSPTPDVRTGERFSGVQLSVLADRVAEYDGEVYHRKMYRRGFPLVDMSRVAEFIDKYHGRPYESSNRELANAALDLPLPWELNEPDDSTVFCSELAALAFRAWGIMVDDGTPANERTPKDFSKDLPLADGWCLSPVTTKL